VINYLPKLSDVDQKNKFLDKKPQDERSAFHSTELPP